MGTWGGQQVTVAPEAVVALAADARALRAAAQPTRQLGRQCEGAHGRGQLWYPDTVLEISSDHIRGCTHLHKYHFLHLL